MRVLITGATSGLGAAVAHAVATFGHTAICLGRDRARVEAVAAAVDGEVCVADLADLGSLLAGVDRLDPVDVVIGNAAVQYVGPTRRSRDGLEETFAVNHLAHLALTDRLLARSSSPGRVVFVSSDTHDVDRRTGTPPPLEDSIADLARPGEEHGRARDRGMQRYVTTKLLLTAAALGLADEHPDCT
ncbi:MAG: SDR family NAD(P)-dependent oxidoreductase [Dermatophilaceae bacterium]